MGIKLGVIMDPIDQITPYKDTSFAMLLEAQARGYELFYMEQKHLFIQQGQAQALMSPVQVQDTEDDYYQLGEARPSALSALDVIIMRKDPPVDAQFTFTTHMLSLAEAAGTLVVNNPQALRDFNEKLFTSYFPELIPPTLVSANAQQIRAFHAEHKDIILKPLDGMGGTGIFRVDADGQNLGVIIETLTQQGQQFIMVQRFLPEISEGDKRILIVDGEVMPYALARLPSAGETRGNLAAGGTGRPQPLTDADKALAETIAPKLREHGLRFVGLDVIGDRVTEINITSPTCVREIEAAYPINICAKLMDAIENTLSNTE